MCSIIFMICLGRTVAWFVVNQKILVVNIKLFSEEGLFSCMPAQYQEQNMGSAQVAQISPDYVDSLNFLNVK